MSDRKGYILVEGHGELEAAQNLIARVARRAGFAMPWATPRRWTNLHRWTSATSGGVERGAELFRAKPDVGALVILHDADDDCPAEVAPARAAQLASLELPFPTAYVLLKPEYEVLFTPCLDRMEQLGFPTGLRWPFDSFEHKRGVKEWLSGQLPRGRSYKPTTLQLPMTRAIDLEQLSGAGVPCFGTLERGIAFLRDHLDTRGAVYPSVGRDD